MAIWGYIEEQQEWKQECQIGGITMIQMRDEEGLEHGRVVKGWEVSEVLETRTSEKNKKIQALPFLHQPRRT